MPKISSWFRPVVFVLSTRPGPQIAVFHGENEDSAGRMRLRALVRQAPNIARFLAHLGLPTEALPLARAQAPPYWQSRVLRRLHGAPAMDLEA